ncbi:MAG TPA: HEAT repeat domain-containing protein, partial [Polyangiales bacterium]|nr:HEAT repeat domain-containing protein [Polyangiales bacterium]
MTWLLPPLPPKWDAALRDVRAQRSEARIAAAQRLAEPGPGQLDAALDGLHELVKHVDPRTRAAALDALGELADVRSLPQLTAALEDELSWVRELAVLALARLPAEQ